MLNDIHERAHTSDDCCFVPRIKHGALISDKELTMNLV